MKQALSGRDAPEFEAPPGLVEVWIDGETGYRAGPECPHVMREAFVPRTEPREVCPVLHYSAWPESLALEADSTGLEIEPPPGFGTEPGD
jgi:membrane carboxypeptidase/penicillin-binding protein